MTTIPLTLPASATTPPHTEVRRRMTTDIPRLYGPLQSWFDKTWRPGEIELVD
jgi:hypothetical protein